MSVKTMHIQKTGVRAGLPAVCPAEQACRNGGRHFPSKLVDDTKRWLVTQGQRVPKAEITEKQIDTFLKKTGGISDTIVANSSDEEDFKNKIFFGTSSPQPSKSEIVSPKNNSTTTTANKYAQPLMVMNANSFNAIETAATKNGMKVTYDRKTTTHPYHGGPAHYTLTNVSFTGSPQQIQSLNGAIKSLNAKFNNKKLVKVVMTPELYERMRTRAEDLKVQVYSARPEETRSYGLVGKKLLLIDQMDLVGSKENIDNLWDWTQRNM